MTRVRVVRGTYPGLLLPVLVVSALLGRSTAAQQPPSLRQASGGQAPQFKSGTQVVEVDVRVFDKDGHFVTDLKPEDFEVKEDGAPQPINTLTLVGAPGSAPSSAPSTAPSTEHPAPSTEHRAPSTPSATWIFVFDTTHLSTGGLHNTQAAVVTFLRDKFHQGDIAGIVANGKMANNRLTSVRDELVQAAENVKLPDSSSRSVSAELREWPRIDDEAEAWAIDRDKSDENVALQDALHRACIERPEACTTGHGLDVSDIVRNQLLAKAANTVAEFRESAKMTLTVIEGLSNGLTRIAGPKTIVFVTEGFILNDMEEELKHAEGLANRAGAHLYVVDARGLNKGTSSSGLINQAVASDPFGPSIHFEMRDDSMTALAADTGGMFIRNENNFGRALDEIQQDAGTYYVLGYTPANQTFDGKYRAISVTVKRPGVKVRARRGYLALEPAKLLKPAPITTAPAPTRATGPAASTALESLPGTSTSISTLPAPPPAAASLRSTIESHGFVEELQKSAERLAPSKADDLAGKGWKAYQKGDVEHAATYLGEAATSPDAHPWVRYALGLAHLALDQYPEAVRAWEQVRRDVPEFEPVYFNLADGYLLQKQEGQALKVLRAAEKRWPQDPEVADAIGVLQVRRGALDAAIESFTRATTVAPADSLGFFNLGRAYQMRAVKSQRYDSAMQKWVGGEGDLKKAKECYETYIQMGGPFVQQAKEALAALAWQGS